MLTHLGACTARVLAVSAPRALARGTPTASRALPARLLSTTPHRPASSSRRSRPGEHRAYLTSQATPRRSRSSCRTAQRRACEFPLASSRTSTRLPSAETLPPAALTSGCATTAARSARTTLPPVSGSSTRQRSVDSAPTRLGRCLTSPTLSAQIPADYRPQAVRSDERGVSLTCACLPLIRHEPVRSPFASRRARLAVRVVVRVVFPVGVPRRACVQPSRCAGARPALRQLAVCCRLSARARRTVRLTLSEPFLARFSGRARSRATCLPSLTTRSCRQSRASTSGSSG